MVSISPFHFTYQTDTNNFWPARPELKTHVNLPKRFIGAHIVEPEKIMNYFTSPITMIRSMVHCRFFVYLEDEQLHLWIRPHQIQLTLPRFKHFNSVNGNFACWFDEFWYFRTVQRHIGEIGRKFRSNCKCQDQQGSNMKRSRPFNRNDEFVCWGTSPLLDICGGKVVCVLTTRFFLMLMTLSIVFITPDQNLLSVNENNRDTDIQTPNDPSPWCGWVQCKIVWRQWKNLGRKWKPHGRQMWVFIMEICRREFYTVTVDQIPQKKMIIARWSEIWKFEENEIPTQPPKSPKLFVFTEVFEEKGRTYCKELWHISFTILFSRIITCKPYDRLK